MLKIGKKANLLCRHYKQTLSIGAGATYMANFRRNDRASQAADGGWRQGKSERRDRALDPAHHSDVRCIFEALSFQGTVLPG